MGGGSTPGGAVAHQLDCVSEDAALDGRGGGGGEREHEREL